MKEIVEAVANTKAVKKYSLLSKFDDDFPLRKKQPNETTSNGHMNSNLIPDQNDNYEYKKKNAQDSRFASHGQTATDKGISELSEAINDLRLTCNDVSISELSEAIHDLRLTCNDVSTSHGLNLPSNLIAGRAVTDGSCFFDSFRQGLRRLGIEETVQNLRRICKEFAESPPNWFVTAIANSYNQDLTVRTEIPEDYIDAIERSDRWGDPDIEGRILCGRFGVTLYLIEKLSADGQNLNQMIEGNGCKGVAVVDFQKGNSLYIINGGHGHFEPIIDRPDNNKDNTATDTNKTPSYKMRIKTNKSNNSTQVRTDQSSDEIVKRLVIEAFNKFEGAISKGDVNHLSNLIDFLYRTTDKVTLMNFYNDNRNLIRNTHLITLACKYNQPSVLDFLLHKSNILCYLPNEGPVVERAYTHAVCATMQTFNIRMLETLYDYWSGSGHWRACAGPGNAGDVISNLRWLNRTLIISRKQCKDRMEEYQQMPVDVHCLLSFNTFQIELYTELSKLKGTIETDADKRLREVETTIDILLTAFRVHEKYSAKNIRLTKHLQEDINKLEPLLQEDSIYMKGLCYDMYELYYRKLDYNIALLIINNIHFLKLRLSLNNNDTYQEIESALYYFLYRYSEDWRLYLPENRELVRNLMIGADEKSSPMFVRVKHEPDRLYNWPVIYLEWLKYKKSLNKFKDVLKSLNNKKKALNNISIKDNLRPEGTKLAPQEIHSLLQLPYMRDDYSLKKILDYMDQMCVSTVNQSQNVISLLVIQRVIQVTGEFFKSTDKTYHLSSTAMALLRAEIPRTTYKNLTELRDNLSHVKGGQLIRRIDLETSRNDLFNNVLKDLEQIKKAIAEVINVYKPVLDKSLLMMGLKLLGKRYDEHPETVTWGHRAAIEAIFYSTIGAFDFFHEQENEYIRRLGITRQLFREIGMLGINKNNLRQKWDESDNDCYAIIYKKLPQYTVSMLRTINDIESHNRMWDSIRQDLSEITPSVFSNYPNKNCIDNIKTELEKLNKKDLRRKTLTNKLKTVKDWTNDYEWIQLKGLLGFIIVDVDYFKNNHWEIKRSLFSKLFHEINSRPPDDDAIDGVRRLIAYLIEESQNYQLDKTSNIKTEAHEYKHIDTLADALRKKRFLTQKEKKYLKDNTANICDCGVASKCKHRDFLAKIYNDIILNEKEHENTKPLQLSDKCRRIIENIVNGCERDFTRSLLECLVNRMRLLNKILEADRDQQKLVLKYRYDETFRLALEMIASDIMNIYEDGGLKELSNTRYTELLREYPLRNILDHGHPLIDIGSASFDAEDFPNTLVSFALDVLQDEPCLEHLYKLYNDEVDRSDVINDSSALSEEQKEVVGQFKRCPKWKTYVRLMPDKNQQQSKRKKKKTTGCTPGVPAK